MLYYIGLSGYLKPPGSRFLHQPGLHGGVKLLPRSPGTAGDEPFHRVLVQHMGSSLNFPLYDTGNLFFFARPLQV